MWCLSRLLTSHHFAITMQASGMQLMVVLLLIYIMQYITVAAHHLHRGQLDGNSISHIFNYDEKD